MPQASSLRRFFSRSARQFALHPFASPTLRECSLTGDYPPTPCWYQVENAILASPGFPLFCVRTNASTNECKAEPDLITNKFYPASSFGYLADGTRNPARTCSLLGASAVNSIATDMYTKAANLTTAGLVSFFLSANTPTQGYTTRTRSYIKIAWSTAQVQHTLRSQDGPDLEIQHDDDRLLRARPVPNVQSGRELREISLLQKPPQATSRCGSSQQGSSMVNSTGLSQQI